jgi:hypothetical protein
MNFESGTKTILLFDTFQNKIRYKVGFQVRYMAKFSLVPMFFLTAFS